MRLDYKPNGEPICESDLFPHDTDEILCDEFDSSTEELLRQLDVTIPSTSDSEKLCDALHLQHTLSLTYRGETYFVDPADLEDIELVITGVLDTFFGFSGTIQDKDEFNSVLEKLLAAIPDELFQDEENKLLELLSRIPKDPCRLAICQRVKRWDEERYKLLLICAVSICNIPEFFLRQHSKRTLFRKCVYDFEKAVGDCRNSTQAYSQVKQFLDQYSK